MKFASFIQKHRNRLGVVRDDGSLIDVQDCVSSHTGRDADSHYSDLIRLIEAGPEAMAQVKSALADDAAVAASTVTDTQLTWLSPVVRPSKLCCIALNNSANSERIISGPDHPAIFIKAANALVGHGGAVRLRPEMGRAHPEPELAVIIGKEACCVPRENAYDYVFGYTIHNDITSPTMRREDTFHYRAIHPGGNESEIAYVDTFASYPGRYKCSDTFSPVGPYVVTKDEIEDPHALSIVLRRGDEIVTEDNTANLTNKIPEAMEFITRFVTLMPGDILSMGTAIRRKDNETIAVQNIDLQHTSEPISIDVEKIGTLTSHVNVV